MASLECRVRALEAHRQTDILFFCWRVSGNGKAATEIEGVAHVQGETETRETFLERVASLARTHGRTFLWINELDEKL